MEVKKRKKITLIIYIIIVFILGIIYGRLFAETVHFMQTQKQLENIENQYNEITKEYEALRATYINEI